MSVRQRLWAACEFACQEKTAIMRLPDGGGQINIHIPVPEPSSWETVASANHLHVLLLGGRTNFEQLPYLLCPPLDRG